MTTMGRRTRVGACAMLVVTVGAAIAWPLVTPATAEHPTGHAGVFASLLLLCAALRALMLGMHGGRSLTQSALGLTLALGSSIAAYYALADATGLHPRGPDLPLLLFAGFVATLPYGVTAAVGAGVIEGLRGDSPPAAATTSSDWRGRATPRGTR